MGERISTVCADRRATLLRLPCGGFSEIRSGVLIRRPRKQQRFSGYPSGFPAINQIHHVEASGVGIVAGGICLTTPALAKADPTCCIRLINSMAAAGVNTSRQAG
jgi:hypothetical protein